MNAPALPATVPFTRLEAFLARCGIPIADLVELHIDRRGRGAITTTHRRRDDTGQLVIAVDEIATTVTHIAFDR